VAHLFEKGRFCGQPWAPPVSTLGVVFFFWDFFLSGSRLVDWLCRRRHGQAPFPWTFFCRNTQLAGHSSPRELARFTFPFSENDPWPRPALPLPPGPTPWHCQHGPSPHGSPTGATGTSFPRATPVQARPSNCPIRSQIFRRRVRFSLSKSICPRRTGDQGLSGFPLYFPGIYSKTRRPDPPPIRSIPGGRCSLRLPPPPPRYQVVVRNDCSLRSFLWPVSVNSSIGVPGFFFFSHLFPFGTCESSRESGVVWYRYQVGTAPPFPSHLVVVHRFQKVSCPLFFTEHPLVFEGSPW